MKISARACGGIAGLTRRVELDTCGTPDGRAIEALVDSLDAFAAPAFPFPAGADIVRWDITLDDGRRCRTVTLAEDGATGGPGWQALLAHLRNRR